MTFREFTMSFYWEWFLPLVFWIMMLLLLYIAGKLLKTIIRGDK